ncbi:MAG: DNA polymerase III subunit beta [Kiritimatiellia bacterium]
MKFKIIRSKFIEGLKSVQNIVSGKGSLPILQNVLLEGKLNKLTMTTTDLDISIKSEVACEVLEEGMSTLPVKLLFNSISKVAEGEIEVEIDAMEHATIIAGSAKFKLVGLPENEFPRLPKDDEAFSYTLNQQALREMFRKTSYAASQDDTRRTLKGVLMSFKDEKLTMVATDGRRLALVENEVEFPKSAEKDIVLPFKAVQELQRSLSGEDEVNIMVQNSQISFKLGNVMIYSKLIEETYPNYKQVIPKECAVQITVDRQLLLDALDRASVMTMDEAHSTKLIFEGNRLVVTSAASDVGEAKDEVNIKYAGEKLEIMFNPSYVMDPLKAIDDDEVTINLDNGHSPAVIKCSIPFLYVLMPLRIN